MACGLLAESGVAEGLSDEEAYEAQDVARLEARADADASRQAHRCKGDHQNRPD